MNPNTIRRLSSSTTFHRSLFKQVQKSIALGSMNNSVLQVDTSPNSLEVGNQSQKSLTEASEQHELMEIEMMMNELNILRRGLTPSMHGTCVLGKIQTISLDWQDVECNQI